MRVRVLCRYYHAKEDYAASKAAAGTVETAGATVRVGSAPGVFELHVVTPTRTLSMVRPSAAPHRPS